MNTCMLTHVTCMFANSNRISPFNNNLLIIIVSHRTFNVMRDLFFYSQSTPLHLICIVSFIVHYIHPLFNGSLSNNII